jgi:prepilin-type N-terminal cleavage/methylation domain-containing protein
MPAMRPHGREHPTAPPGAFTLLELLVVIAIIAVLASLLLPTLASAKDRGKRSACLSNLRQIGIAVHLYADEHEGSIPYGPTAPPFTSPADFYPSTGSPTSLLSLRSGAPAGLGLLLRSYLAETPKVLFCPGSDQSLNADAELEKVSRTQAQGSYYYRHAGVTQLFFTPATHPACLQLENQGTNRNGVAIRALAIDSQFLYPEGMDAFNIFPRTHHRRQAVNILMSDGGVQARLNASGRFTVDLRDAGELYDAFNRILRVLEYADEQ